MHWINGDNDDKSERRWLKDGRAVQKAIKMGTYYMVRYVKTIMCKHEPYRTYPVYTLVKKTIIKNKRTAYVNGIYTGNNTYTNSNDNSILLITQRVYNNHIV